uniref:Uncharacterized protein n=1 Tax=Monopsis stellarioides subsp. schimperiana TaxID=2041139 RepID=A0A291F1S1_9ASTR|nr:hypothetical protein Mo_st_sc1Pt0837 [Monopsis stellarioides subsp. schimperiana]ATG26090.1 hypothetical protein Mo_st_sc1Pt1652 [Monopsis stellarioides subsp. schimperiana]
MNPITLTILRQVLKNIQILAWMSFQEFLRQMTLKNFLWFFLRRIKTIILWYLIDYLIEIALILIKKHLTKPKWISNEELRY